jgi:hypothetical protein
MFMAMRSHLGWLAVFVAVAINSACADDDPIIAPTPPVTMVTDTFNGSINKNGGASHSFVVATGGQISATLTTLTPLTDPDPTNETPVAQRFKTGFGVGTWDGTVCTVVAARDQALETTVIYGNVNAAGSLCVRVFDTGQIVDSADYVVTVVHP